MAGRGKGAHVPPEMLLMGVRCSGASPWRYRHGEDRREERGGPLDHATIPRGVVPDRPPVAAALHRRKRLVWVRE